MTEGDPPADLPQPERTCEAPGCSNPATARRDRTIHEIKTGTPRFVTWDFCDQHAAEFDANSDPFLTRLSAS